MPDRTDHMHYVSKEISPEQYIAEHTFVYIVKGIMNTYDGKNYRVLRSGDCCVGRKNRLIRYNKEKVSGELEKVFVFFDEAFLRRFQDRYHYQMTPFRSSETIISIEKSGLLDLYIQSLLPHYSHLKIAEPFTDIKREELLLILLEARPELAGMFFDYGAPEKINIEEFMLRNFRFNVSLERFACLTGRSLSAFKRDFKETFADTPGRWLVHKRLQEAYFLIEHKDQRPSEIYLELGFETLQHFSYSFKKQFGLSPTELAERKKKSTDIA